MKFSLYLGQYQGIKVFIHWTFSIILVWILIANARAGVAIMDTAWSIFFILSLFFCVILHEFGHALTAKKYGIKTRDIILLPIGGLARLEKLPEDPYQELWVAFAGPLVNLGIFTLLVIVISATGFDPSSLNELHLNQDSILLYLASSNLILALFNLIPAFPMDGGRILRAILSIRMSRVKATEIAGGIGQFLAMGFVLLGLFYNPFLVLIGLFIYLGAQAEMTHTKNSTLLQGFFVRDALMTKFPLLQYDAPISLAVDQLLTGQATHFLVVKDDEPIGTLSRDEIIKGLKNSGEIIEVGKACNLQPLKLDFHQPLEEALKQMSTQGKKVALVYENNHFLGILDQENITEFIMVKSALENK